MSDFWSKCLVELKASVSPELYSNWFSDLKADDSFLKDGCLILIADSNAKARTISENYGEKISTIVKQLAEREISIRWSVNSKQKKLPSTETATTKSTPAPAAKTDKTGLLPNLTFDTYVTGKASQLAYTAALQVANSTKSLYNPMIIYGGVGLGKTHLMHAIGHQYLASHPTAKVLCISAQQYLEEFTSAMRQMNGEKNYRALTDFESRYQNLDLLLIDDIQGFATRTGTQANFFQVFEHMVPHGKQIVMTSDTYPRNLKEFQERLLSRITQGLTVEVEPPELDMRVAILLKKASQFDLDLPVEVAEVIAKNIKSNVRELEGAIQQILAYTHFHQVPIDLDSVRIALRDIFRSSAIPVSIETIQQTVADYYNLKTTDMHSKKRSAPIARARQVAMYLSKELTQKSLPEIGMLFGGRDHTTVLYAHRKIAADRSIDESLRHDLHILEQRIKN